MGPGGNRSRFFHGLPPCSTPCLAPDGTHCLPDRDCSELAQTDVAVRHMREPESNASQVKGCWPMVEGVLQNGNW